MVDACGFFRPELQVSEAQRAQGTIKRTLGVLPFGKVVEHVGEQRIAFLCGFLESLSFDARIRRFHFAVTAELLSRRNLLALGFNILAFAVEQVGKLVHLAEAARRRRHEVAFAEDGRSRRDRIKARRSGIDPGIDRSG